MPEKSINAYYRIGLKLLASIGCTELLIMTIFRLIRIETWMPPLLIDLTDTLILCVMASFLILYWVVNPMKILEEREKAKEALASLARFPEENPSPVMRFSFDGAILYANSASLPLRRLWNSELGQKVPAEIANSVKDVCGSGVSKEVEVECGDTIFSLIIACIKNADYVNIYGRDITKSKKADEEIELQQKLRNSLLAINRMTGATDREVFDFALDAGLILSGSKFGFIGKMSADELTEILLAWSKGVLNECAVTEKLFHFPVAEAGLLGEIVRQRRPIIVNDYETSIEFKKGYPEGHVPIKRFLGIPVFNADRIVAVAGWANRQAEYTESDVLSLTALLNETWGLIESKKAAAAMRESESHLRIVLESSADAILAVDHRGKVLWANALFFELWLFPTKKMPTEDETLILEHVLTQVADPEAFLKKVKELYASDKVNFDTLDLKDGRILERYSCALLSDGKNVGRLWSFRDITERKRADDALQSLTLRYKAILAAVPDIIMEVGNNKVYTWANKAGYEFFGDDVIGKEAALYFEGEQQIYNMVQPLFNGSDEVIYVESWQRRKDGEKRLLAWRCRVLKDSERNVTGVLSTAKDITERKQAEEQIRKEKAFSEAILDSLPGIFYLFDHTGRFLRWNRTFETVSGYSAEEIAAMSALDFFTGDDRTLIKESIGKVFETGATNVEGTFISKDGRRTPHYFSGVLFVLDVEPCCIGTGIDITQLKHLEAQLRHAQKMEAVGTLAGGIAHDFNNILNVIMGYGSMVFDSLEAGSRSREQMNEVLLAADRATDLTKRLLVFSRKQVVEVKPININELILGLEKMLVRIIQESIDFNLDLAASPLIVLADAGQIEQVLINLASNARDAMQEGGRLTISTKLEEIDDKYVAAYGYGIPGKYALITVADTGQGMDAETQKKIFEPFFTTKGIGEGTGLGLAISYGIIKQHAGFINVYSEPGQGTVFKIYLPLSEEAASPYKNTEAAIPVKGGNETILLTEDDASIRTFLRILLESFGYNVITAEDGEDAITKFMENMERINLILIDMIMPKKNGKEVSEAISIVSPQAKILFMSGYTMDIIKTNELTDAGFDFIQKPFLPRNLLIKMREVLDR